MIKVEQRNLADGVSKKAHMAYGGNPGDSLAQMMRSKKPVASMPKQAQTLSTQQIQEIYSKVATNIGADVKFNPNAFTKEERDAIKETDEEYKRRGFFKRIFPCYDFLYYKQFFEEDRPLNFLIDAKLFQKKRGSNAAVIRKN